MKKKAPCIDARASATMRPPSRKQQGDALLEALIGMLLIAVLGLGLAYAAGRVMNAQRFAATHGIVLSEMRHRMETTGIKTLCTGGSFTIRPTLIDSTTPVDVSVSAPACTSPPISVAIADGTLSKTLPNTTAATSIVTQMQISTEDNDANKASLGAGAITLKQ